MTEGARSRARSPIIFSSSARPDADREFFTLPSFQLSASTTIARGRTVSGQGTYFYGTTNVLTANANFATSSPNWTANGRRHQPRPREHRHQQPFSSRQLCEATPFTLVTTGTTPTKVAAVVGAGTYTNGQSRISARRFPHEPAEHL